MRTRMLPLLPLLALLSAGPAAAGAPPGKAVFDRHCAECHAAGIGHPGTQMLGWTRGERYALLEQRTDLSADYVKYVVRHGLFEMAAFTPTHIDDRELADLASYLSHGGKPGGSSAGGTQQLKGKGR